MASTYHIHSTTSHLAWDATIPPVLTVPSGAEVTFDLQDGGGDQVRPDNAATALADFDFSLADPAFGPVFVEGAAPGDVLRVDFLSVEPSKGYGWTAVFPGFGLLADEFETPALHMWDLSDAGTVEVASTSYDAATGSLTPATMRRVCWSLARRDVQVPLRPFLGVVGVAPAAGRHPTIPPLDTGGNVDCRHVGVVGSTLFLPVRVRGALFSAGDGHAAQGDGEVCGTAIEAPTRARVRLTVVPAADKGYLSTPHYISAPIPPEVACGPTYAVLGIDKDLREAARKALRELIDYIQAEHGFEDRADAYMLASVAASLSMAEVVDMPNYAVAASIPLSIFTGGES